MTPAAMYTHPIKAVLLDRDGTINVERADYVRSLGQFVLLPQVREAFALLADLQLPVAIVTNQSGLARGALSEQDLASIHAHLRQLAADAGLPIAGFYVCPHHPDAQCNCRKPRPGLLLQAASELGLAPSECLMIGDSVGDFLAARAAGCPVVLVRSGRQGALLPELVAQSAEDAEDVCFAEDLLQAVLWMQTTDLLTGQMALST